MGPLHFRGIALALIVASCAVGCNSSTRVRFTGPSGGVLFIDDRPYHLPADVSLTRPGGAGSTKHNARLIFTSQQSQEIRAKGVLEVFAYTESDIDKAAVNTCYLDEAQLLKIPEGTTVVFRGQSASRQPLYDLTLGR